ncbi:MAG: 2-hydroxyacyl-CoA dehydratase subunit D [Bacillota bacterium]
MASEQKTTAIKSTQTAKEAYQLTKQVYRGAHEAASEGRPIAWCMAKTGLEEILETLDITTLFPENYGGVMAAKRVMLPYIEDAEADGFSAHICGYARCGLGYVKKIADTGGIPSDAPLAGMPIPSIMLSRGWLCDAAQKWFQAIGRYLDVPSVTLDLPLPPVDARHDEVWPYYIKAIVKGLREIIPVLEKVAGKCLDYDRLSEMVDISEQTRRLFWECHELRKAVPCPMPSADVFSAMVPGLFIPSKRESKVFYEKLYAELKERVDQGIGAIPNERFRLLWGELPPWHSMNIFDYFASKGACFVIEAYYYYIYFTPSTWTPPRGVSDPLERIAWNNFGHSAHLRRRANLEGGSQHYAAQQYVEWAKDYQLDGAVFHRLLSCRAASYFMKYSSNLLWDMRQIPSITIDGDMTDIRVYDETKMKMKVDAFLELLAERSENRGVVSGAKNPA